MKKPVAFPQGTQRIARIGELCEPNTYVLEPAAEAAAAPSADAPIIAGAVTDAELASAVVGEAPVSVRRARRFTNAYTADVAGERKIVTIA